MRSDTDGVMIFLEWREAFLRTWHLNKYLKKLRNETCTETPSPPPRDTETSSGKLPKSIKQQESLKGPLMIYFWQNKNLKFFSCNFDTTNKCLSQKWLQVPSGLCAPWGRPLRLHHHGLHHEFWHMKSSQQMLILLFLFLPLSPTSLHNLQVITACEIVWQLS